MKWLDYTLTIISIICTGFSVYSAWKSNDYYEKNKLLTLYANTNVAYIESQTIIAMLTEMLKLSNTTKIRGKNYTKRVSENGEIIKKSINKIRESMSVEDFKGIQKILNDQEFKVENYIDTFITGTVLVNEKFEIDDNFNTCQQVFCDIQLDIKEKLEKIIKKVK